ncbi:hypothetical protein B5X24_HaOG208212 [Helicoverpa armigera]|uniref:Uncharacterized protein n=1 Tax=Helicoverpa armigera TaxID=29058 RepID=A0A2W1BMT3_HELAM|nr:hypothetical protein B5X24_HaOG208212 [Helicoverpa armigera]
MPKRSAQSKIDHYTRKIRKIEEKERKRRRIIPLQISSSEDEGNEHSDVAQVVEMETNMDSISVPPDIIPQDGELEFKDTLDDTAAESCPRENSTGFVEPELDPDLLSALGESTSDVPDYGESIHSNLSQLWQPLLKKGMPKENKDKLLKEYLVPDNCRLLQAPKLNAEISAAVPDMVRNRDKTLIASQQQLGAGITAINRGMDVLLKNDNKVQAMKHFSNGCRLLCDSHFLATQARVKLITPSLDKAFLNVITDAERDESLFGSSLSEKIKAAKTIEKQGLSIKKPAKVTKPPQQVFSSRTPYQGNWNPPPPRYPANRGGRGAYRRPPSAGNRRPNSASTQPTHRPATQDKSRAPAASHR